jgi:hypothetical protein
MRICGIPTDFGMSDLASPVFKRYRNQLCAALNFIQLSSTTPPTDLMIKFLPGLCKEQKVLSLC